MIYYSSNWMGPINQDWVQRHGDHWCIGRIDIYGTDDSYYSTEIALPMMHADDWYMFGKWLEKYRTETVCTLDELVLEYEKSYPKIKWFKNL